MLPFAQTAQQISTTLPIKIGKRQVEALTVAAAVDFEAFYAARRPAARPDGVGLLITADGSSLPVRPEALRPATPKPPPDPPHPPPPHAPPPHPPPPPKPPPP